MINMLLSKISNEINIYKPSNGDIIQALCMALVVRCKIIDYDINKIEQIVNKTIKRAFSDAKKAEVLEPLSGNSWLYYNKINASKTTGITSEI